MKKSYLAVFLLFAVSLLATAAIATDEFTTDKVVGIIEAKSGILPDFYTTSQQIADLGMNINLTTTDPKQLVPIYQLAKLGQVLSVVEDVPEWNSAPPVLYRLQGGPLGHNLANKTRMYTQTPVVVYNGMTGELQYWLINPWGKQKKLMNATHEFFYTDSYAE